MNVTNQLLRDAVRTHLTLLDQLIFQDEAALGTGKPWKYQKELLEAWLADATNYS